MSNLTLYHQWGSAIPHLWGALGDKGRRHLIQAAERTKESVNILQGRNTGTYMVATMSV